MKQAFQFLKDEGTYHRIRPVMEGRSNNENAEKHAQVIKSWFNNLKNQPKLNGKLYRGIPFRPKGNLTNKSFSSWTRELHRALRFTHGLNQPGTILVMNANKAPKYVRWEIGKPPTFTRRHNIEAEVLRPPGIFVLGNSRNGNVTFQSFGGSRTEKTHFTNVKNFRA